MLNIGGDDELRSDEVKIYYFNWLLAESVWVRRAAKAPRERAVWWESDHHIIIDSIGKEIW